MMSIQEREHWDHEDGAQSETLNCLQEASAVRRSINAEQSLVIAGELQKGRIVVVEEYPHHCRATDAVTGTVRAFRASFASRAEADAKVAALYAGEPDDSQFFVLPALPVERVAAVVEDDGVPF